MKEFNPLDYKHLIDTKWVNDEGKYYYLDGIILNSNGYQWRLVDCLGGGSQFFDCAMMLEQYGYIKWDMYDEAMDIAVDMYSDEVVDNYPNIKQEQEEFNKLCYNIMMVHSKNIAVDNGMFIDQNMWNPYYNANETINVFEIVLQYVPDTAQFLLKGRVETDDPTDQNILEGIRRFIVSYGTDENMLPAAVSFNKMCKTIAKDFHIQIDNIDDFDPYNNINDLAPIFPLIVKRVGVPFTLGEIMADLPAPGCYDYDVHTNMLRYAIKYTPEILKILES